MFRIFEIRWSNTLKKPTSYQGDSVFYHNENNNKRFVWEKLLQKNKDSDIQMKITEYSIGKLVSGDVLISKNLAHQVDSSEYYYISFNLLHYLHRITNLCFMSNINLIVIQISEVDITN